MRTLIRIAAAAIVLAAVMITTAPLRALAALECGPPLHATGKISLATAARAATPHHLTPSAAVGFLYACNGDKFGKREAKYLDGGSLTAPMPKHMRYWLIEGSGGLP